VKGQRDKTWRDRETRRGGQRDKTWRNRETRRGGTEGQDVEG
jgi:hypothetical protein